ncbi:MAG: hypothetical protein JWN70_413 [Planctomycetaceae bacterium]|nr:hypothetical protein [Planctomycetaceae bacterium]
MATQLDMDRGGADLAPHDHVEGPSGTVFETFDRTANLVHAGHPLCRLMEVPGRRLLQEVDSIHTVLHTAKLL